MTKADFIKALEPYPDDMEVFAVDLYDGEDFFWKIEKVSAKEVTLVADYYKEHLGKLVIALE
jgi:hypothetical protein